jgi:hypothetical protein
MSHQKILLHLVQELYPYMILFVLAVTTVAQALIQAVPSVEIMP